MKATAIAATEKYLTVEVRLGEARAHRLAYVKVPLAWLLADEVTDALDRHIRRRLIQVWSEVDLSDPLF